VHAALTQGRNKTLYPRGDASWRVGKRRIFAGKRGKEENSPESGARGKRMTKEKTG